MTRFAVILGALALVATAGSVQAGLKEGPEDVHGDGSCHVQSDSNVSAGGVCCGGQSDGSISCEIMTVTTTPPSADYRIVPRKKFLFPYVLGARPSDPPWRVYLKPPRWPLVSTLHVQGHQSISSSVIAHASVPVRRFGSGVISHLALGSHAALISHAAFASHVAFGKSFGHIR